MTDDSTHRTFGTYEIMDELGRGGMGKVYRARHVTLDRIVALKMLSEQFSTDHGFVQRFLREARTAARLNHPNIVQIYDFGQVGKVYYLAMEFVEGHSVGQWLRSQGRFTERDGVNIIRYVCIALGVAHSQGMVHRDVKPDNMMLSVKGEVKLVDLGLAKSITEDAALTQTGNSMGTPHYISPEQIKGLKDIDRRADIYSLGAIAVPPRHGPHAVHGRIRARDHDAAPDGSAPRPAEVRARSRRRARARDPENDGQGARPEVPGHRHGGPGPVAPAARRSASSERRGHRRFVGRGLRPRHRRGARPPRRPRRRWRRRSGRRRHCRRISRRTCRRRPRSPRPGTPAFSGRSRTTLRAPSAPWRASSSGRSRARRAR